MRAAVLTIALMVPQIALSQDDSAMLKVQRSLEMPAHRTLQSVISAPDTKLSAFETDGCSGGMSWSWRAVADLFPDFEAAQGARPPWEQCCVIHDRAYHNAAGATTAAQSFEARLSADQALQACVVEQGEAQVKDLALRYEVSEDNIRLAYDMIATSMFNAVRFGGGPCSGLPWRWGFGYPGCIPGL